MERKNLHSMKSLVKHFMFLALIVLGATGAWAQTNNTINLATVTSNITVNNGYTLTGTLGANVQISIANGATVTLNNVTINGVDNGSYNWAGITCNGNATLILVGENTVKGFYSNRSGIFVPANSTLTIQGSGSLTASSNGNGVGIGGNKSGSGGNIIIAGGTITATGGNECAGIGGGQGGSCGNISITSGIVIATGGNSASGIGGGKGGSCGNISITGGTVTATGGNSAPGIGGGGSSCNINISGGMVTATGGNSAPGIGGKQSGGCGTITIANTVTGVRAVKGGNSPHSIGAGQGGGCGTVTVNGNVSDGISTSPYSYPSYTLDDIPTGWSVRADNNNVTVTDGVASIPVGATVVLTPPNPDKPRVKGVELLSPEEIPLTFEAIVDNATVTFTKASTLPDLSIEYSKNGEEWTAYSEPITLNIGEKVSFRGDNTTYATSYNNDSYSRFSCTNQCYVYGNIMSLINSDTNDYATNKTLEGAYAFCKLFFSNNNIYSHASKELILPATTLSAYCYDNMFYQCSNLTNAPVLPATTLTDHCYFGMFMYCHGITTAPELPAKTLAPSCYYQMFAFTNIIATPELPAKTLATSCYKNMFQGCTYLTTATALPATTLASNCYSYMFIGCSNLTTAPELPATMLENNCYNNMFKDCTHLNKVTCLATDISAPGCTTDWLAGVAGTGTFIKPSSMNDWTIGPDVNGDVNGIPTGWIPTDVMYFTPLTFEAKTTGAQVTFTKATIIDNLSIEYSTDGTTWTTYVEPVTLNNVGDKVMFRGNNATYATYNNDYIYSYFSCSADCYIYGNIMSLINEDNFANTTILTKNYTFHKLFENNDKIYYHGSKPLLLPATTLRNGCYWGMFSHCTQLTKAPALPATTLENFCYAYMFEGCTKLETAPALPATTLANNCYSFMFDGCTQLTTAPVLPATTLTVSCYRYMFNNCSHLNNVTCLATDISADDCTTYWLSNVAATGTFNKAASMTTWPTGPYDGNVDGIPTGWTVVTYETVLPLTFEAKTAGATVTFGIFTPLGLEPANVNIEYSLNDGAWTAYSDPITLTNVGDKVSFRGDNATYYYEYKNNHFSCSDDCYIYGNIMSLVNSTNFTTTTTLTEGYAFNSLFKGNDKIYNHASKMLVLPATTLRQSCYAYMFRGCTSLTVAPALPAEALANNCYQSMFEGCTNLTAAPNLPATNLFQFCYAEMFKGCTSLTTAPNLPATSLASTCYANMFNGCTNLLTIPTSLPATTLQEYCYMGMFEDCTSLTMAPLLPATTMKMLCYDGMFSGCTSLATAPTLPATTLAHQCYAFMFSGCTSLTTAPELPATTLSNFCYNRMFGDCSSLTSAPKLPATTLADGCYQAMFQGCTSLTTAPTLPATTLTLQSYWKMFNGCTNLNKVTCLATSITATNCTEEWLDGVASSGTFNKAASMTGWTTGANGIPTGWTVVDAVIDLSTVTTDTIVPNGWTVTGTLGSNVKISIADGATVTLNGATINGVHDWSYQWAGLNCIGDATIILADGTTNTVKGFYENYPGIHVPSGKTLTIQGTGSLTASSNGYGAGIGGGNGISCGNITIRGGTITATGGENAAGIGAGYGNNNESVCGNITITGGTITATGGDDAAGIGSGTGDEGSTCGNITISGGTVTATGGDGGAGIGSGNGSGGNSSSCGDITITNAVTSVTATKGSGATNSIGAGNGGTCGTVTVGGVVGAISTSPYTYPVPVPSGAINGKFTINASGDQVYFSQGNLKYSNGTWSFHDNQYDMCFTSEGNLSSYYNVSGTFDLFGWGTSGYNHGAMAYLPYSTSTTSSDYYAYGASGSNLYDGNGTADWGYNAISNGGNTENQWRTLKTEEWVYVLSTRTVNGGTGSGKSYTLGQSVNGVLGVVLYPDDYTGSEYSGSDWATFEAAGCVFLPAAGYRKYDASAYDVGSLGYYWSSSRNESFSAYYLYFSSGIVGTVSGGFRYFGYSVRLVKDAN